MQFVDFTKPKRTDKEKEASFICKDYVPLIKNGVNLIVANGGVGKTALSIKIGLRLARNMKVFAHLSEDLEEDLNDRVHDSTDTIDSVILDNFKVLSSTTTPGRLVDKNNNLTQIANYAFGLWKEFDVVVIDPLVSFIDEMDNETADATFGHLNKFCIENNVTLLLLHHTTKGTDNARGVTSITNKPRLVYKMSKITKMEKVDGRKVELVDENKLNLRNLSVYKCNNGFYSKLLDRNGIDYEYNEDGFPMFELEVFRKEIRTVFKNTPKGMD